MFARVGVNRLNGNGISWEGPQKTSSDFWKLGGRSSNPKLLDWLAAEFVRRGFSMEAEMTKLMVTSETYKLAIGCHDPQALERQRKSRSRGYVSMALQAAAA